MGQTNFTGPLNTTGNTNPSFLAEPSGTSLFFQGTGVTDPRYIANFGGNPNTLLPGVYTSPLMPMINGAPATAAVTKITSAQSLTAGSVFTLNSAYTAGYVSNLPIIPFGSAAVAANVVTGLALDFGFMVGDTTSSSTSVTIVAADGLRYLYVGQKIIIAGAGNSAKTLPLITTVVAISSTTLTIADAALSSCTSASIGSADRNGLAASIYIHSSNGQGPVSLFAAAPGIARGVSITRSTTTDQGTRVTISGYNRWLQPQTETIAFIDTAGNTGTVTAYGWKTWALITGATPAFTATQMLGTISIGTSNLFGLGIRSDYWENVQAYWGGALIYTAGAVGGGWTTADATSPATAFTKDTLGTIQIGTLGPHSAPLNGTAPNGTLRLVVYQNAFVQQMLNSTNLTQVSLFGVTPA